MLKATEKLKLSRGGSSIIKFKSPYNFIVNSIISHITHFFNNLNKSL